MGDLPIRSGEGSHAELQVSEDEAGPSGSIAPRHHPRPRTRRGRTVRFQLPAVTFEAEAVAESEPEFDEPVRRPEMQYRDEGLQDMIEEGENGLGHVLPHLAVLRTAIETPKLKNFDSVLDMVEFDSKYQRRILNWILFPIAFIWPVLSMDIFFMLVTTDHWCGPDEPRSPGTDLKAWKEENLPLITGPDGEERYSQCTMYRMNKTVVECLFGWEYDLEKFQLTMQSDFDWVCDNSHVAEYGKLALTVGSLLGAVIFGCLADWIGRKRVFIAISFVNLIGHVGVVCYAHYINVLYGVLFLCGTTYPLMVLVPMVISLEMSTWAFRARILCECAVVSVLGHGIIALLTWTVGSWFLVCVATCIFSVASTTFVCFVYESPRWLFISGKIGRASHFLMKMASMNESSRVTQPFLVDVLQYMRSRKRKKAAPDKLRISFFALFTRKNTARNVSLLLFIWFARCMIYETILVNMPPFTTGPLSNYFMLQMFDIPGYAVGGFMSNRAKRPRANVVLFLAGAALSFVVFSLIGVTEKRVFAEVVVKEAMAASLIVTYSHFVEVLPTVTRMTGVGIFALIAFGMKALVPISPVLFEVDARTPYFICCLLALLAALASSYLPETKYRSLPDTLDDAAKIEDTKQWNFHLWLIRTVRRKPFYGMGRDNPGFSGDASKSTDEEESSV